MTATVTAAHGDAKQRVAPFRPEIQGLRALAVALVVAFHLWPDALTGGYVGVDVFFVISGFLITAHLLRESDATGTIGITRFWARRARRLLPASLLVLGVVCLALMFVLPWNTFFLEVVASAFYAENWAMAYQGVDYLASTTAASPVQHFWSLSVEEQFYLGWPLLFVVVLALTRRTSMNPGSALRWLIVVVLVAGLAYSVYATIVQSAAAYYATPTRVWEFAVGGALAAFGTAAGRLMPRVVVGWLGLAAIVVAAVVYDASTPFPGAAALLPALGAAAVIWAGSTARPLSVDRLARFRPVQWVGDVSYSVYLWHWPLIVFATVFAIRNPMIDTGIVVASLLLAWLTKRFVEDPARSLRILRKRRIVFAGTALVMAVVAVPAAAMYVGVGRQGHESVDQATALSTNPDACFGAPAHLGSCTPDRSDTDPLPSAQGASYDDLTSGACWSRTYDVAVKRCEFGDRETASLKVAVVGDSHGSALLGAFQALAEKNRWYIQTYLKAICGYSDVSTPGSSEPENCATWKRSVETRLKSSDVDVVLVVSFSGYLTSEEDARSQAAGYSSAWSRLIEEGIPVVAVPDNPTWTLNPDLCLVAYRGDVQKCSSPASQAYPYSDPKVLATGMTPGVRLVELRDLYCPDGVCAPVIGGATVYRDPHHLTAAFARSLAPELARRVDDALTGRDAAQQR